MARDNKRSEAFYDELVKQDFYQNNINKVSSNSSSGMSKYAAKEILENNFSPDQLEALAEEIDNMFSKTAEEPSLQDRVVPSAREDVLIAKKRSDMEDALMSEDERIDASEERDCDKIKTEDERIDEGQEEAERDLLKAALAKVAEERAEEVENSDNAEDIIEKAKEIAEQILEEAVNEGVDEAVDVATDEEDKKASWDDDTKDGEIVVKYAYDLAYRALENEGLDLSDYVSHKITDKIAAETIADKSEKLAYITGKNSMQVARDVVKNIYNLLAT